MHTILGAGGPVANALTHELINNGHSVRLVSRNEVTRFPAAQWVRADLTRQEDVLKAVKGSQVIYMVAGLRYNKKVWSVEWPQIMDNLIVAARTTGARLIFFDNVYMYGHVSGEMTENSPYQPDSKKGEIRARTAQKLMEECARGNIRATIARAADFYGAETLNSSMDAMVLAKYAQGKRAMWIGNPNALHSYTFVPDAGRDMFLLGQNEDTNGQVWHLRTARPLKGTGFLQLASEVFNTEPKYTVVNKFMLRTLGIFKPMIGEITELYYQYQFDYVFNSDKFERRFGLTPTPYRVGMEQLRNTLFAGSQQGANNLQVKHV